MDKSILKKRLLDAVEAKASDIIAAGQWIWDNPEVGFKEYKTAEYTSKILKDLGLDTEENLGLTGVLAKIKGKADRPNIAVIGELDALTIPEHPD
jgi:metal-dependent amidase/aminoacylase/carboxypeptidase family protein